MNEQYVPEGSKVVDTDTLLPIHYHPVFVDGRLVAVAMAPCDCGIAACDLRVTRSTDGEAKIAPDETPKEEE